MKQSLLPTVLALVALPALTLSACDKKEEEAASAEEKKNEPTPVDVGLPPAPNFDEARAPETYPDGDVSIFGLRKDMDASLKAGEAGTEVVVKGFVQDIYQPPVCEEGDTMCDLGKQPHLWIVDKADQKGKKRAMMVVGYKFKLEEFQVEQYEEAPLVEMEVGKQYRIKGKFKRFSDAGFAHNAGLFEFVEYEKTDAESGQTMWVAPPGAPWHPIAKAAEAEQQQKLIEAAQATAAKKPG